MKRPRTDPTKSKRIEAEYYKFLRSFLAEVHHTVLRAAHLPPEQAEQQMQSQINFLLAQLPRPLLLHIKKMYGHGIKWAVKASGAAGFRDLAAYDPDESYTFSELDRRVMQLLHDSNLSQIKKLSNDAKEEVLRIIRLGVMQNKSADEIARLVSEAVGIKEYAALRLVRSETMTAVNEATAQRYKQMGGVEVEWLTAEDERVCPVCREKDGKRYPIDKRPPCPGHPNCRCTWIPVIN